MEDLTGGQFGQYQIVAPLGEGGMAAVYKAYQPAMERFVAVKVLPRQMASSAEFVARFRREAKMLAQLQHPHILPVFDYGEAEGFPYIVMPFVISGTLADILHRRHLSLAEVRRIMTQIADALSYAHTRGMIHRDIKPSNVLVDERGNCLLTDFGLARMAEASTKITTSGAIMGTPAYMSPEQGGGEDVDQRSDIYSLGIILYEMITGRVPFTAETPIAVVFKHIQDPLPSARKFNPDLPDAIELMLLKALAKRPEDRYQTAEEFEQALQIAFSDAVLADYMSAQGQRHTAPTEIPAIQPIASVASAEASVSPFVPQSAEDITREEPINEIAPTPPAKNLRPLATLKNRRLPLTLIIIGLVVASLIGLAASNKYLVTDPPSITPTDNISNLFTSISAEKYYIASTFLKDQDVYVDFDLHSMQAKTPFESRWYYGLNIFGKEIYFLVNKVTQTSEAGDSTMYFYLNKPAVKGYYRVDIYMDGNLVGTSYFSVQ